MATQTLTIVIPSLNCCHELGGCLSSIANAIPDLLGAVVFVHVQDGGSDDGTSTLLYDAEIPGFSFAIQDDAGVYSAMNSAIAICKTDWIYFLGSDDRLLPGFRDILEGLKDRRSVYYGNVIMRSSDSLYDGTFSRLKLVYRNICHQAVIYPTAVLQASPFNTRYSLCADWAKNIELIGTLRFLYAPAAIANYNDLSGLSHATPDKVFEHDKPQLCRKHLGRLYELATRTQNVATFFYQKFVK